MTNNLSYEITRRLNNFSPENFSYENLLIKNYSKQVIAYTNQLKLIQNIISTCATCESDPLREKPLQIYYSLLSSYIDLYYQNKLSQETIYNFKKLLLFVSKTSFLNLERTNGEIECFKHKVLELENIVKSHQAVIYAYAASNSKLSSVPESFKNYKIETWEMSSFKKFLNKNHTFEKSNDFYLINNKILIDRFKDYNNEKFPNIKKLTKYLQQYVFFHKGIFDEYIIKLLRTRELIPIKESELNTIYKSKWQKFFPLNSENAAKAAIDSCLQDIFQNYDSQSIEENKKYIEKSLLAHIDLLKMSYNYIRNCEAIFILLNNQEEFEKKLENNKIIIRDIMDIIFSFLNERER